MEQKPLEKSAYLKLYGKLFDVEKKSDSLYNLIENNYNELKLQASQAKDKPEVICNEMYGNQWFVRVGTALQHNTLKMPMPAIHGSLYLMKTRFL